MKEAWSSRGGRSEIEKKYNTELIVGNGVTMNISHADYRDDSEIPEKDVKHILDRCSSLLNKEFGFKPNNWKTETTTSAGSPEVKAAPFGQEKTIEIVYEPSIISSSDSEISKVKETFKSIGLSIEFEKVANSTRGEYKATKVVVDDIKKYDAKVKEVA